MKRFYLMAGLWAALFSASAREVATFDDFPLEPGSWYNGSDGAGGFASGGFWFPNDYNAAWGSWAGFSVSNKKDNTTAGYGNQYSAITAGGVDGSENYAVAFLAGELEMELENPAKLTGFYVTNSTYAYLSMQDGDAYSKKFGGADGSEPDYFKLIVSGVDIFGNKTGEVEFFLADFRAENPDEDYLVNTWEWVNLSDLGVVTRLKFSLESTDLGDWGMNTPAYFCIDDFNGIAPGGAVIAEAGMEDLGLGTESFYNGSDGAGVFTSGGFSFKNNYNSAWGSWAGFAASAITDNETPGWDNQYSAIPGSGALESDAYAVSYASPYSEIEFEAGMISGFYITNATYAYLSMKEGDAYSKKFGGADGNDPDWFKVTIAGISEEGDTTGMFDYYLADFRFENNTEDFILDSWEWVDLSSLGQIAGLRFSLSSSDMGDWGMNTPAYFCIDQVNRQDLPPVLKNPVATLDNKHVSDEVFYVELDSVFTDPDNDDSSIELKLEYIDNPVLLTGSVVTAGKPGEPGKTMLALNVTEGMTGEATVTISGTSNGKKVWHSFKVIMTFPVSVPTVEEMVDLNVYPNPVKDIFFVDVPENAEKLILTESSGRILYQQSLSNQSRVDITALKEFPAGLYFLSVKTDRGRLTQKVLKY